MKFKLSIFVMAFIFGILSVFLLNIFLKFYRHDDLSCKKTIFSKKHYFIGREVDSLMGKRVVNNECGKIKCPSTTGNCSEVKIGESGTIVGAVPRHGIDDNYLVVVKWDFKCGVKTSVLSEQDNSTCFSNLGNDQTYSFSFGSKK